MRLFLISICFVMQGVGLGLPARQLLAQAPGDTLYLKQTKVWFGSPTPPPDRIRPHIYPLIGFHFMTGRVGPYWINHSALGFGTQMRNKHTIQLIVGSGIGPPPKQILIDAMGAARNTNVNSASLGFQYQYQHSFRDPRWAVYGSIGIQGFSVRFEQGPGLYYYWYSSLDNRFYQEDLTVLRPELGVLLNVVRFLRLRMGLQYVFATASSTQGFALAPRDIRAPQFSAGFELSDFSFRRQN